MRLICALLSAAALALTSLPASANTIAFGSATNNTSCSLSGSGGDRSCTNNLSISNGALDSTASLQATGQASADHGITTNPTAIADITVSYTVPYTVTRTITFTDNGGGSFTANVPTQTITFDLTYGSNSAHDSTQSFGGLSNANAYNMSVSTGLFGSSGLSGAGFSGGNGNSEFGGATVDGSPDISGSAGLNFSGPAVGEITFAFEIPTDYRGWTDVAAPHNVDYLALGTVTQSFSDSLTFSFRLRAESRPEGSVSATGGEAIACAGQTSPLGSFDADNGLACGSGLQVAASVTQNGTANFNVIPEPGTLALMGSVLLGLGLAIRRRIR